MELNLLERMLMLKDAEDNEIVLKEVDKEIDILLKSPKSNDFVRISILKFISKYNNLSLIFENENIKTFTENLIACYQKSDISIKVLELMKIHFQKASSVKALIDFSGEKSPIKPHLECSFKLLLLTKNAKNLIFGIKYFLKKKLGFMKEKIEKIDLESPFGSILSRNFVI